MNEADGIRLMEFLDGTLSPEERAEVEAWLAEDPEARRLAREHRLVWDALGEAWPGLDVPASEDFRRRAIERVQAQQSSPARRTWLGVPGRAAALLAASLIGALALFAWLERPGARGLSSEDRDVVANLDLLESLDFVDKRGEQLDLAGGTELLSAFDGELPEAGR